MKHLFSFFLLYSLNTLGQSKDIDFSIRVSEKNKNTILITKLSLANPKDRVIITSPPTISDEDDFYKDYKIFLRRKTQNGFEKVSAGCCHHPTLSVDSITLEFNKPVLDTFYPIMYYTLKKGTYKVKVIRHVNINGEELFISSNWAVFRITKELDTRSFFKLPKTE